jgi:hypothetical protein
MEVFDCSALPRRMVNASLGATLAPARAVVCIPRNGPAPDPSSPRSIISIQARTKPSDGKGFHQPQRHLAFRWYCGDHLCFGRRLRRDDSEGYEEQHGNLVGRRNLPD